MKVEVFRTNISEAWQVKRITEKLFEHLALTNIHFDLEDCDKILRVEGEIIDNDKIISVFIQSGFTCEILE